MSQNNEKDWVDTIADMAAALGFNRVQVRWKLDKLRRSISHTAEQTKGKVSHVGYANKVCPHCHSVNDAHAKTCARCGQVLGGRVFQVLSRIGILTPQFANISSLIGFAMVIIYARMIADSGGGFDSIISMNTATLFKFGAGFAGAYHNGEWYRLLTTVFLHAGLWHLGFNLLALSQLGPFVEEIFGKARMVIFFVLTGIVASLGSLFLRAFLVRMSGGFMDVSVTIGASGAIMGLMGIMVGWGHRDGTGIGRNARNMALKWAVYTMVFGFIIGADNGAHAAGFILGAGIGLAINPLKIRNRTPSRIVMLLSFVSGLLIVGTTVACLIPMPSVLTAPFEKQMRVSSDSDAAPAGPRVEICGPLHTGDKAAALRQFLVTFSPNILMTKPEIEALLLFFCAESSTLDPDSPDP